MGVLALIPFAYSNFYPGGNTPVIVTSLGTDFNGLLVGYGDTNGSCFESDVGFNPHLKGTNIWVDPTNGNFYQFSDACDTNHSLIELSCSNNVKINGKQYQKYVFGAKFNCKDLNAFSTCNAALAKCQ